LNVYLRASVDGKFETEINKTNPLGMGGKVVEDYAVVLKELWSARTFFRPSDFKVLLNCFRQ